MKKEQLLYLKKAAILGCMLTSTNLLSGCGQGKSEPIENKKLEDIFHYHLMVDIGGTTYIFRECEDEIGDISIRHGDGDLSYFIKNENNEDVLNSTSYSDCSYFVIYDELEEEEIREFEEQAIENGAILYRGLSKTKN